MLLTRRVAASQASAVVSRQDGALFAVVGAPLGLDWAKAISNGALQVNARPSRAPSRAEDHVRLSEAPSRLGYVHIFRTKVTLEDRERPLKQLKRFGRISKVAMRVSKTPQRKRHVHMVRTVFRLLEVSQARAGELARLGGVAMCRLSPCASPRFPSVMATSRAIAAVLPLKDRERALQHVSRSLEDLHGSQGIRLFVRSIARHFATGWSWPYLAPRIASARSCMSRLLRVVAKGAVCVPEVRASAPR